jgi:hypothetical protein
MATITVDTYKHAAETLRAPDLRQALYDEGAILMEKVLVNLHGDEHKSRRIVEGKAMRRDYFRWYETEIFPKTLHEPSRRSCSRAGPTSSISASAP